MEGEGGMNDDRQAVEAVARTLHEWYGGYSDESATDDARNLLAVVRDAGWQPAPTVAPSVDEIAAVIRDWLLDHLPPHRPEPMAEAVAAADPRRTEAEVKAEALEEAADNVRRSDWYTSWKVDNYAGTIQHWLRARADRLREAQQ